MNKEKFLPIDLGHLEEKAIAILNAFKASECSDRSEEYRAVMLKKAKDITNTLVQDFRYYFDTKEIGGLIPYDLDEVKKQ